MRVCHLIVRKMGKSGGVLNIFARNLSPKFSQLSPKVFGGSSMGLADILGAVRTQTTGDVTEISAVPRRCYAVTGRAHKFD